MNLKELRSKKESVQATRRITSAMKMVAASKLNRAKIQVQEAAPYAQALSRMLATLLSQAPSFTSPLLQKADEESEPGHVLLLAVTSDRGLCGGFNASIMRETTVHMARLEEQGHKVSFAFVGRKGLGMLGRSLQRRIFMVFEDIFNPTPEQKGAEKVASDLSTAFDKGQFDRCIVLYNHFVSVLEQNVTSLSLVPFTPEAHERPSVYAESEPDPETVLTGLLYQNLSVQLLNVFLNSFVSEQGARMAAMDNATRNAGDRLDELSILYNRTRQAHITNELIEIISGAEAL